MTKTDIVIICAFYVFFLFAMGVFVWVIEIKRLNKIVDKLEQRIATLEKVLASHAKCIGEMRENKDE